jgi:DeoR/GlpR family transcriptional regulator of sugar metabolism
MRGSERRARIESLLASGGEVSVDDLALTLDVTPSTIRRDLTRLATDGKITRTLGGAISGSAGREQTLHEREAMALAEKRAIGVWAASQVRDHDRIILDAGTTVGRLAQSLVDDSRNVTVLTNGLTSLDVLADADTVDVVVLGGELRHISQGFVGPMTEMMLSRLTADRVFLGADGLDAKRGLCEASSVQTRLKELMIAQSRAIYVLADHTKLGHAPFDCWAPIGREWTLVTDATADDAALRPFLDDPLITVESVVVSDSDPVRAVS